MNMRLLLLQIDVLRTAVILVALLASSCAYVDNRSAENNGGGYDEAIANGPSYRISGAGGKSAGPLRIRRAELYFNNHRSEITVPMHSKLGAYAVLKTDGSGLLRTAWAVDGRILERMDINLTFGSTVTINTSPNTILPTFEPGPHRLELQILEPTPGFAVPGIRYFVTGEKAQGR